MTRALQAASVISTTTHAALVVEFDLREWLPAADQLWLGRSVPEAAQRDMRSIGGEWPVNQTRPWEPLSAVRRRALAALRPYLHHPHAVVVTHGVLIEAITGRRIDTGTTLEVPRERLPDS
jgi:broad specificity phosphatase PhoE